MNVGEVFSAVVMLIISFGTSVLLEYQDISFKINFPPLLSETSEVKLPPPQLKLIYQHDQTQEEIFHLHLN